ncbi:hypothetical protein K4F52_009718 [Lecanicillium sp. MT-2017a]|nr:hypothetical protein K4F52_009718 [Lecanicillium sp. MT-2017a]
MTPDSIYWIASCTKMLTALSCMQLVERGQLSLDDSDQLEKLCPELRDVQVLKKDGTLEPKRNRITLRMLLTHTAGFGYAFFNERLRDYGYPAGIDEFSGSIHDLKTPLLFHPGEGREYGVNIDWAGIALERATGLTLNDYMQENICKPLGLKNLNMIPTPEMKANLAHMHQRLPSGEVIGRDHPLRRPLIVQTEAEKKDLLCSGGAGMYAKPQEYCRVLAVLLNDGTCPKTGVKLLEKATVDEMFKNQIPDFPQFGRQNIPASKPDLTNAVPDLYPTERNSPQGWGLSMMITGGATGRSEGTAFWAGLCNLFWWVDRENGVGGMICSQVLPFGDAAVLGAWIGMEATIYQALKNT